MTEIAGQDTSLTLVERRMENRDIAQGPALAVVLRRRYDAPVHDVWKSITTPDRIDRFSCPWVVTCAEAAPTPSRGRPAAGF